MLPDKTNLAFPSPCVGIERGGLGLIDIPFFNPKKKKMEAVNSYYSTKIRNDN